MMYNRVGSSRGLFGSNGCFGYGFMNSGWNVLIAIGVFLIAVVLIYFLVHKNKNQKISNDSALETLKMKYVQGAITEEEYLKRKDTLDREY